jgi:hypothetical protein
MDLHVSHVELIAKIVTSDNPGSLVVDDETVELDDRRIALRAALPVLERQLNTPAAFD